MATINLVHTASASEYCISGNIDSSVPVMHMVTIRVRLTFCPDKVPYEWPVSRKLTFCPDIVGLSNEWLLLDIGHSFDTTAPEKETTAKLTLSLLSKRFGKEN